MTKKDLRIYWYLLKHSNPEKADDPGKAFNALLSIKSKIRNYYREESEKDSVRYIGDSDYDSYTQLIKIPEFIKTESDAESYFKNNYYREYIPSQYDCTGQHFTTWYKIVKRSFGFVVYNHVCIDC